MRKQYLLIALAFAAVFAKPALAAQTISLGGKTIQTEYILASVLGIYAIYNFYKQVNAGKGGNTGIVIMSMFASAWINGGFETIDKVINLMVAATVVQSFFDEKGEGGEGTGMGMLSTPLRAVVGYQMVQWVAGGMDAMTAIMYSSILLILINSLSKPLYNLTVGGGLLWWKKEQSSGSKEDLLKGALGEGGFSKGKKDGVSAPNLDRAAAAANALGQQITASDDTKEKMIALKEVKDKDVATFLPHNPGATLADKQAAKDAAVAAAKKELKKSLDQLETVYKQVMKPLGMGTDNAKKLIDKAKGAVA